MLVSLGLSELMFKVSSETAAKELEECQANMLKLSRLLDVKEEEINVCTYLTCIKFKFDL